MELDLSDRMKQWIAALLLIILPLVTILLGLVFNIQNAWYYVLSVTWFGVGVIFFSAII